jgi:hypothetical protein
MRENAHFLVSLTEYLSDGSKKDDIQEKKQDQEIGNLDQYRRIYAQHGFLPGFASSAFPTDEDLPSGCKSLCSARQRIRESSLATSAGQETTGWIDLCNQQKLWIKR